MMVVQHGIAPENQDRKFGGAHTCAQTFRLSKEVCPRQWSSYGAQCLGLTSWKVLGLVSQITTLFLDASGAYRIMAT